MQRVRERTSGSIAVTRAASQIGLLTNLSRLFSHLQVFCVHDDECEQEKSSVWDVGERREARGGGALDDRADRAAATDDDVAMRVERSSPPSLSLRAHRLGGAIDERQNVCL